MIQVSEIMTRGIRKMTRNETVVQAAQAMSELNVGIIPICDQEKLVGVVTDRDIVVRVVAQGGAVQETPLSSVMSQDAYCCFEDQSVDEVAEQMRERQIRRVPVLDREKHLVGMLSLGDVATKASDAIAGETLEGISQP